jgi:hypothetical protein
MKELTKNEIDKSIEGSMLLSLLNRVKAMDAISNATYSDLKQKILSEYQIKLN